MKCADRREGRPVNRGWVRGEGVVVESHYGRLVMRCSESQSRHIDPIEEIEAEIQIEVTVLEYRRSRVAQIGQAPGMDRRMIRVEEVLYATPGVGGEIEEMNWMRRSPRWPG